MTRADLEWIAALCLLLLIAGIYGAIKAPSDLDWLIIGGAALGLIGTLTKRARSEK